MDPAYIFMFGPEGLKVFGPFFHPAPFEVVLRRETPLNPGARFYYVDPMSDPPWPQLALKDPSHADPPANCP